MKNKIVLMLLWASLCIPYAHASSLSTTTSLKEIKLSGKTKSISLNSTVPKVYVDGDMLTAIFTEPVGFVKISIKTQSQIIFEQSFEINESISIPIEIDITNETEATYFIEISSREAILYGILNY